MGKMPFTLTGVLKKVVIEPGKSGLTASDERDTRCEFRDACCKSRITNPVTERTQP